jgi:hypothetical protein
MTLEIAGRRKPAFTLPASACDAHCHVLGLGGVFLRPEPSLHAR